VIRVGGTAVVDSSNQDSAFGSSGDLDAASFGHHSVERDELVIAVSKDNLAYDGYACAQRPLVIGTGFERRSWLAGDTARGFIRVFDTQETTRSLIVPCTFTTRADEICAKVCTPGVCLCIIILCVFS
jgi:hypothetical protein